MGNIVIRDDHQRVLRSIFGLNSEDTKKRLSMKVLKRIKLMEDRYMKWASISQELPAEILVLATLDIPADEAVVEKREKVVTDYTSKTRAQLIEEIQKRDLAVKGNEKRDDMIALLVADDNKGS